MYHNPAVNFRLLIDLKTTCKGGSHGTQSIFVFEISQTQFQSYIIIIPQLDSIELHILNFFNPLPSRSDWPLISPYSTKLNSNIKGDEDTCKGNNHRFKKLLIVKQILLVKTTGYVKRTVGRI